MPLLLPAPSSTISARLRVLEAYIETLKAENESLKRQLSAAEKRAARETAKAAASITEFSAITKRLTVRAASAPAVVEDGGKLLRHPFRRQGSRR
jgi:hypothetical protein